MNGAPYRATVPTMREVSDAIKALTIVSSYLQQEANSGSQIGGIYMDSHAVTCHPGALKQCAEKLEHVEKLLARLIPDLPVSVAECQPSTTVKDEHNG